MTRALVLGGGGPVGIAWESGLMAGLAQAGVDLGQADFTMGTSAGSFVGARLALGSEVKTLADPIIAERIPGEEQRPAGGGGPPPDLSKLMQLMGEAQGGLRNPAEVRAEIGAFALAAQTQSEEAFIESFGRSCIRQCRKEFERRHGAVGNRCRARRAPTPFVLDHAG